MITAFLKKHGSEVLDMKSLKRRGRQIVESIGVVLVLLAISSVDSIANLIFV